MPLGGAAPGSLSPLPAAWGHTGEGRAAPPRPALCFLPVVQHTERAGMLGAHPCLLGGRAEAAPGRDVRCAGIGSPSAGSGGSDDTAGVAGKSPLPAPTPPIPPPTPRRVAGVGEAARCGGATSGNGGRGEERGEVRGSRGRRWPGPAQPGGSSRPAAGHVGRRVRRVL